MSVLLALTAAVVLFATSTASAARPPVGLGTATSFSVLAGSTVTNTGATTMAGDLGVSPGAAITGFPPGLVGGATHAADAVAGQAESDLTTAYIDAAGRTPVTTLATELGGQTLTTGVYDSSTGTFGLTGTLTLDAEGNPNAVFIFHTASTLITGVGSSVSLINAAQACNVFWQVGSSATIATTSTFKGTIMALTSIAMQTGASLEGSFDRAHRLHRRPAGPVVRDALDRRTAGDRMGAPDAAGVADRHDVRVRPEALASPPAERRHPA